MQDKQQFEQLILQYTQLKNGSEDIRRMIENENFDDAISMLKTRESVFLNCKCIRKFLELNREQEEELNLLLNELKESELSNIKLLQTNMSNVQRELKLASKVEKFQQAYDFSESQKGNIINYKE